MAVEVEIDVEVLKSEIKKTYPSVSQEPEKAATFEALQIDPKQKALVRGFCRAL
jgi:hypothetical protein